MEDTIITPETLTSDAPVGDPQATGMDKAKGVAIIALAAYGAFTAGRQVFTKVRAKIAEKQSETSTDE